MIQFSTDKERLDIELIGSKIESARVFKAYVVFAWRLDEKRNVFGHSFFIK
jgi:hypothetical protein